MRVISSGPPKAVYLIFVQYLGSAVPTGQEPKVYLQNPSKTQARNDLHAAHALHVGGVEGGNLLETALRDSINRGRKPRLKSRNISADKV